MLQDPPPNHTHTHPLHAIYHKTQREFQVFSKNDEGSGVEFQKPETSCLASSRMRFDLEDVLPGNAENKPPGSTPKIASFYECLYFMRLPIA